MDDDWPLTGDCGDTIVALERNVRPSPAKVFAGIGAQLRQMFTVSRIEPKPRVDKATPRYDRLPLPPHPDGLPFWGGTP